MPVRCELSLLAPIYTEGNILGTEDDGIVSGAPLLDRPTRLSNQFPFDSTRIWPHPVFEEN